jgi:methionyl-tRNA synthetase
MSFYITTPIYYINDLPHIGHAYTTIIADVLARYHKLFGEDTYFLTGTDEHGQKVQTAAKARNKDTQEHVDELAQQWQATWPTLHIQPDFFMRTTFDFHKTYVQSCLDQLFKADEIYSKEYSGWYCVSEEVFYKESDLVNGKTPTGKDVQLVSEKNYFFRMSKYQDRLIDYIKKNPLFIRPEVRRNEILGFLAQPLEDLCISRPKSRLAWGIELPFDPDYVTYVWFDALLNYISALVRDQSSKDQKLFERFWPECIHLLGKDIITTHAVYWTTMLMALNIPLPKGIFAHGWWLAGDGEKMSKSIGNVTSPLQMKEEIGPDALRYYLVRDAVLGSDARFARELVATRVNTDLSNNFGNLLSRTVKLAEKFCNSAVPAKTNAIPETDLHAKLGANLPTNVKDAINNFCPQEALVAIFDFLSATNRYLDQLAPWKNKDNLALCSETIGTCLESLHLAAQLLIPVMPEKMMIALDLLGSTPANNWSECSWGTLKAGAILKPVTPLFPKVE